jgi:mono/diheme cytochrome c family protein
VKGATVDAGRRLFARACARCHGDEGRGAGTDAKPLRLAPTDLTGVGYLCRTTVGAPVAVPSDRDIEGALERGTHRTVPALSRLRAAERRSLTLFVKSLSPEFARAPQPLSPVPPEPPDDRDSRARGRTLYLVFGCWQCHGMDGRGGGAAVKTMRWNGAPVRALLPLGPGPRLCGGDAEAIYRRLDLGIVGSSTLMPAYGRFAQYMSRPVEGDPASWARSLAGRVPEAELAAVRAFYRAQPTKDQVLGLPENARRTRAARFLWDLVHHVRGDLFQAGPPPPAPAR